jgi:hypothetical protein
MPIKYFSLLTAVFSSPILYFYYTAEIPNYGTQCWITFSDQVPTLYTCKQAKTFSEKFSSYVEQRTKFHTQKSYPKSCDNYGQIFLD